jgi:hypothetical protein
MASNAAALAEQPRNRIGQRGRIDERRGNERVARRVIDPGRKTRVRASSAAYSASGKVRATE